MSSEHKSLHGGEGVSFVDLSVSLRDHQGLAGTLRA